MPARARVRGDSGNKYNDDYAKGDRPENNENELDPTAKSKREKRKLTLRGWLLYNNAVPLVSSHHTAVAVLSLY
jgi:hypothetical protein